MNAWRIGDVLDMLREIAPYPPGVVVCGSWAVPLYRLGDSDAAAAPSTLDVDLALDGTSGFVPDQDTWMRRIFERLRPSGYEALPRGVDYAGEGFVALGHRVDPLAPDRRLPTLEFLGFVRGGGKRPPPLPWTCVAPRPQRLDRMGLLLVGTWSVQVGTAHVPVPNPLGYVLQKARIRSSRRLRKWGSDARSIVDVATHFAKRPERIAGLAARVRAESILASRELDRAVAQLAESCLDAKARGFHVEPVLAAYDAADAKRAVRSFLSMCGVALP